MCHQPGIIYRNMREVAWMQKVSPSKKYNVYFSTCFGAVFLREWIYYANFEKCRQILTKPIDKLTVLRYTNPRLIGLWPAHMGWHRFLWRRSSVGQSIRFIPEVSPVRIQSPLPWSFVGQALGALVKRLRHRPFTAVTRVRFPYASPRTGGIAPVYWEA